MPKFVLLFGPPGAGKGTQAQKLTLELALPHVASGDLFRFNLQNKTPLGILAKDFMDKGELVPDDVTIRMIRERLQQPDAASGALLDGFPRTVPQAEALDALLTELGGKVDVVLSLNAQDAILLARLTSRWVCKGPQQHVYNIITKPPMTHGVCDVCGEALHQREDDTRAAQQKRLAVFRAQTEPLITHYTSRGLLRVILAERSVESVTFQILEALRFLNRSEAKTA